MKETSAEYLPIYKQKPIDGYQRFHTYIKAGIEMNPAFIYSMDRNEAVASMEDSNLHREKLLLSEKAFTYWLDGALGIETALF